MYQPNNAAATGTGSNRKAPCLRYTSHGEEVLSLTQRYGPESLSQYMIEHCHEARSIYESLASK